MDPYNHPSRIPTTLKERLQQQQPAGLATNFTSNSSSSSNFDSQVDHGQLYSPAEVRSIDVVRFDTADIARLEPVYIPSSATRGSRRTGGGNGISRRATTLEVNVETDTPSVPASPLGQAQESVRKFSVTDPLPIGSTAPGSPAVSVMGLIQRYTRRYHGGVEASLHYVLAIMNPTSGETGVSQVVLAGLRDELGTKRVLTLTGDLFADPSPIRLLIKEQAVIYHPPGQPGRQQRGTVVVCGGDGTVSFLMTQMDLVQRELETEFQPFLTHKEQSRVRQHYEDSAMGGSPLDLASNASHPYFTLPALAPLPLGTGNDYSNTVGFGSGFSPVGSGCCSGLLALCGCGDGGESQVATALKAVVSAPCVTFDRWEVSLVPLQLAQRTLRAEQVSSPLASNNSGAVVPTEETDKASATQREETGSNNNNVSRGADRSNRTVRSPNVANQINLVDWERLYATKQVNTYGLINYFSVGYDAYVATKFDATRRAHPVVCSTRTQNKAVYVSLGIGGAMRCKKLRKLVPMICVPRPTASSGTPNQITTSTAAAATTTNIPVSGSSSDTPTDGRDLIALQLPSMTKSLVVSNVSCYGAGTHPWNPSGGELYYRPVAFCNGELVPSPATTISNKEDVLLPIPTPRPVTINDRAFEVQAMGGLLHYGSLGVGLSGAVKLLQTHEMFAFVLCTPEDLQFPSGQCSAYTQRHFIDKYVSCISTDNSVRASLCVQIDGEAMPSITEPTIVHMRRQQGSRIVIRCRNTSVVQ